MPTVLVSSLALYREPWDFVKVFEAGGFEIRWPTPGRKQLTHEELIANLDGIDSCLAGSEEWTAAVFAEFPAVRVVSRCGVGYDSVDMKAATAAGVAVGYTPGTNHEAVAEGTFALLLGLTKEAFENHRLVTSGEFTRRCLYSLRGRTLGIVGLGRIGKAVALRAKPFGLKVLAVDPFIDNAAVDPALAQMVDLETVLSQSDIISMHTPLTDETREMINARTIAKMRDGVVLINTSRGGVIKEADLAAALKSGKVAWAGLDVFAEEPPIDSPLLTAPNTLLSPHVAGIDEAAIRAMAKMAAETIVDLYHGRWPTERVVNHAGLKNWKW